MKTSAPSERSRVKRYPQRAVYDRAAINAVLDEALVCHVAFVPDGIPRVIPTGIARMGDSVLIHGNHKSYMLQTLAAGAPACIAVTHLDGIVVARSAFNCSMNYRSVVIFGVGTVVEGQEKVHAMNGFVDQLIPGHSTVVRTHKKAELDVTTVLRFALNEASAKIRQGPPVDDEEDYDSDVWAGVIPLGMSPGPAVADPRLKDGIQAPRYIANYAKRAR